MPRQSKKQRWTVVLMIVALTTLTGCWSMRSFVLDRCPCFPQIVPKPIALPTE
jgi:hypothetical protein